MVIVAGSRTATQKEALAAICAAPFTITVVVSGGARGADAAGESWARVNRLPCTVLQADWDQYGKAAGPRRNRKMAEYADAAIVVWDGLSRGSANMIAEMNKRGKPVWVHMIPRAIGR